MSVANLSQSYLVDDYQSFIADVMLLEALAESRGQSLASDRWHQKGVARRPAHACSWLQLPDCCRPWPQQTRCQDHMKMLQ